MNFFGGILCIAGIVTAGLLTNDDIPSAFVKIGTSTIDNSANAGCYKNAYVDQETKAGVLWWIITTTTGNDNPYTTGVQLKIKDSEIDNGAFRTILQTAANQADNNNWIEIAHSGSGSPDTQEEIVDVGSSGGDCP